MAAGASRAPGGQPRALGWRLAALVLAAEQADASGKNGRNPRPKCSQAGKNLELHLPFQQRIEVLAETNREPPAAVQSASAICQP